jgi:hypothetical protein
MPACLAASRWKVRMRSSASAASSVVVVIDAHQPGAVIGGNVLAFRFQASKTCWRKFSVQLKLGELL